MLGPKILMERGEERVSSQLTETERKPIIQVFQKSLTPDEILSDCRHSLKLPYFRREILTYEGYFSLIYHKDLYPNTPEWIKYLATKKRMCTVVWGQSDGDIGEKLEIVQFQEDFARCKMKRRARGLIYFQVPLIDDANLTVRTLEYYCTINARVMDYRWDLRPALELDRLLMQHWIPPDEGWEYMQQKALHYFQEKNANVGDEEKEFIKEIKKWRRWGEQLCHNMGNLSLPDAAKMINEPWHFCAFLTVNWERISGMSFQEKIQSLYGFVHEDILEDDFYRIFASLLV